MVVGDERESKGRLSSADVYHGQGQDFIFYLIIYRTSQHSSYQAWTGGEGERFSVMERRKMRKRRRGGAARWRKQRRGGGGQETRGHRSVSAYVREIPQIGHSPGSDGLKLHSGEWAHTTCNHTHIIQAHAYSILWEAEVWPTLREDAARCMGAGVWNLTLR